MTGVKSMHKHDLEWINPNILSLPMATKKKQNKQKQNHINQYGKLDVAKFNLLTLCVFNIAKTVDIRKPRVYASKSVRTVSGGKRSTEPLRWARVRLRPRDVLPSAILTALPAYMDNECTTISYVPPHFHMTSLLFILFPVETNTACEKHWTYVANMCGTSVFINIGQSSDLEYWAYLCTYLFYLTGVLRGNQEYFTCSTVVSLTVERNRAVPRCLQETHDYSHVAFRHSQVRPLRKTAWAGRELIRLLKPTNWAT